MNWVLVLIARFLNTKWFLVLGGLVLISLIARPSPTPAPTLTATPTASYGFAKPTAPAGVQFLNSSTPTRTAGPSPSIALPAYEIIEELYLIDGGRDGDILIKEFSRNTPMAQRELVFRAIIAREGFTQASFYATREAEEANYSASYLRQHPNAMTGYLGSLNEKGAFSP